MSKFLLTDIFLLALSSDRETDWSTFYQLARFRHADWVNLFVNPMYGA